jgi:hypothetical protein
VLLARAELVAADIVYSRSVATWLDGRTTFYGNWPPGHFQYCSGSEIIARHVGYRFDPLCVGRGLPMDGDAIDRAVADGWTFSFVDEITHEYFPNRQ